MRDIDKDWVWLAIGGLAVGGAIYLAAIDKVGGDVVAALLGFIVKGFVDALGHRGNDA